MYKALYEIAVAEDYEPHDVYPIAIEIVLRAVLEGAGAAKDQDQPDLPDVEWPRVWAHDKVGHRSHRRTGDLHQHEGRKHLNLTQNSRNTNHARS